MMHKLVYLNEAQGAQEFLQRAAWSDADGVEVDITGMNEDEFLVLKDRLATAPVATKSLHYERTNTIALQEWELYRSQLEMMVSRANDLNCTTLSVHPPRVEIETTNTLRDLEQFVRKVDEFAADADMEICFELTGFMKDPQLINIAFQHLDDPALGVMIDLESLVDGINPVQYLEKLDVDIHKVRFPMSLDRMDEEMPLAQHGTAIVASRLE
jgi:hypothetical protein